ncbi:MAG: recombination-associated protein RdgC [Desulfobacterales bacterium]|nr:recombination-associated protein RdgC [Desulfobacterales bacterium]MCP4160981.1 recombination-associated protein RdgC [Deltaproteobacteria bacterium]
MGILSASASISKYRVVGEISEKIIEVVTEGLKKNTIIDIDDGTAEVSVGWTSTQNNFKPYFEDSSFLVGQFFIFSLRVDKKKVPAKVLKKHVTLQTDKKLEETGKEFISKSEKQRIKEQINEMLLMKMHATPNTYDLIWNFEDKELLFFTTQKAANEELETLFSKSFGLTLIKMFPYTIADLTLDLSEDDKDKLNKLIPANFKE